MSSYTPTVTGTGARATVQRFGAFLAGLPIYNPHDPFDGPEMARFLAAVSAADGVIVSQIARLELLKPEERLDPERLMRDLQVGGKTAAYLPDVGAIVNYMKKQASGGDIICVFSNGGFGGIHEKLLATLGR